MRTMDAARRRELRRTYGRTFDDIVTLLERFDPVGLAEAGAPRDEYRNEASTIIPRLRTATSVDQVSAIVHDEFVEWFDEATAGPPERYGTLARAIWGVWLSAPAELRTAEVA
jgi:hypothetical protein